MTKPITPDEVTRKKQTIIPDEVFEAFNELITKSWNGVAAWVGQDAVVSLIRKKLNNPRTDVFTNGWLDVEDIYRAAGWIVEYNKPGYNEDYEATFTFRKKERTR